MSLILEALRKSEAERRRGSTPDVAMELPPTALSRARPAPGWLVPAIAFTVFGLLAAWWWSQRDADAPTEKHDAIGAPAARPPIDTPAPPVVRVRPVSSAAVAATPTPATVAMPAPPARPMPTPAPAVPQPLPPPSPSPADGNELADIAASSLPPVKLSMHIWDASPDKRFVILDGQRMGEGDRNGEITVVAIERDGVVVERNGQRARVPLP